MPRKPKRVLTLTGYEVRLDEDGWREHLVSAIIGEAVSAASAIADEASDTDRIVTDALLAEAAHAAGQLLVLGEKWRFWELHKAVRKQFEADLKTIAEEG